MNDMSDFPLPPNSPEAEFSVIGGLIVDNIAIEKIHGKLRADDFYRASNRVTFSAIVAMLEQGRPVDFVTLCDELGAQGMLDKAGGMEAVARILRDSAGAANIAYYAGIVHDKSIQRGLLAAANRIVDAVNEHGTTKEMIERAQAAVMEVGERRQQNEAVPMSDVLTESVEGIDTRFHSETHISGLRSGFVDFDELTSGMQAGDLIVIAGRPSMGKTSLAMNIAEHVAIFENKTVAVFSLEMARRQLSDRLLSSVGRILFSRIRSGKLSEDDWSNLTVAVGKLNNDRIVIDDTSSIGLMEMRISLRRIQRKHGLGLVIIDYLQLMDGTGENRTQQISGISRGLKAIAKDFNVPVIALSQLSREVEKRTDKRPVMSDVRDGGSIEQDADVIAFAYRDEVYNKDSSYKGQAELLVRKQRNGPTGEVRLMFRGEFMRFENFGFSR